MTDKSGWLREAARSLLDSASSADSRDETSGRWVGRAAGDTKTRRESAAELGARAAAASASLPAVVDAFLRAASDIARQRPHTPAAVLLEATRELVSVTVKGYQQHTRLELTQRRQEREQFITDLLTGRGDPGRLAARAQRYGIHLSGHHAVTIVRSAGLTNAIARGVDQVLAARFGAGNTLTSLRDHDLICICAAGLRGVPAELAHHLRSHLPAGTWHIGVGRSHAGLHGLVNSLEEARNTLELAGRLGFSTPVLHAADLLVFPVLLRDRDAITDLVTTVLGPLTQARGGAQPLLDTLTTLFEQQGNHTATAKTMHISVRAVRYRLERIQALTGYHPSEPTQRFTLHTAVLGAKLLGWPDGHGMTPLRVAPTRSWRRAVGRGLF